MIYDIILKFPFLDNEERKKMAATRVFDELDFAAFDKNDTAHAAWVRVKQLVELTSISDGQSCLICIEAINFNEAIWSCRQCCSPFHLPCIQSWAKRGASLKKSQLSEENFPKFRESLPWLCPKCRAEYANSEYPERYLCFCGKVQDPVFDAWTLAHSCGQPCQRALSCKHRCRLLCHPGLCPPCPQTITSLCPCGKQSSVQRCGAEKISCGEPCGLLLSCGQHRCATTCHVGPCLPCPESSIQHCRCQKQKVLRPCAQSDWQCEAVCGKPLSCKVHFCDQVCHKGDCNPCPRQVNPRCFCGKKALKQSCTDPIVSCGDTCNKLLDCQRHHCNRLCHDGPCGKCFQVSLQTCRCGQTQKSGACQKGGDFKCERKCPNMRSCQRHQCKRRCCDGSCPPCPEICGRQLNCSNHRCEQPCHDGPCFPCVVVHDLACACGKAIKQVPCQRQKRALPPRCRELCPHPSFCRHPRQPHACHFGACPPCAERCDSALPACSHQCPLPCHDPQPTPEELLEISNKGLRKKVKEVSSEGIARWAAEAVQKRSICPPCQQPTIMRCVGDHENQQQKCSESRPFQCSGVCGVPLPCGNHSCSRPCHAKLSPPVVDDEQDSVVWLVATPCRGCLLKCQNVRPTGCKHPCAIAKCHPGECPPCVVTVKVLCYCGSVPQFIPCHEYTQLSSQDQRIRLSCQNPCPRTLPHCSHQCTTVCHEGPCPNPDKCQKRSIVRCACKRLKKELVCAQVQQHMRENSAVPLLPCDNECESIKKASVLATEANRLKDEQEKQLKQELEVAEFERTKRSGRNRKRRETTGTQEVEPFWVVYRTQLIVAASVLVLLIAVVIAIQHSDWK